jgi:hypothetical protein
VRGGLGLMGGLSQRLFFFKDRRHQTPRSATCSRNRLR